MMLFTNNHCHFNPASAGATVALDARDAARVYADAAVVTTWTGKPGTSVNAAGLVPTMDVDGLNGLPAIDFPGTGSMLHTATVNGSCTWVIAVKITASHTSYKGFAAAGAADATGSMFLSHVTTDDKYGSFGSSEIQAASVLASGDVAIVAMVDSGASGGAFFRNGAADGAWVDNTLGQPSGHIGGDPVYGNQYSEMKLGAIVLFTVAISDALRRRVEQAWAFSFRIPVA